MRDSKPYLWDAWWIMPAHIVVGVIVGGLFGAVVLIWLKAVSP